PSFSPWARESRSIAVLSTGASDSGSELGGRPRSALTNGSRRWAKKSRSGLLVTALSVETTPQLAGISASYLLAGRAHPITEPGGARRWRLHVQLSVHYAANPTGRVYHIPDHPAKHADSLVSEHGGHRYDQGA